jgi:hypothetical protein
VIDERKCDELRRENERLLVAIAQIERMAAGAIYSQEAIHSVALGALNASRHPAILHIRRPGHSEPNE